MSTTSSIKITPISGCDTPLTSKLHFMQSQGQPLNCKSIQKAKVKLIASISTNNETKTTYYLSKIQQDTNALHDVLCASCTIGSLSMVNLLVQVGVPLNIRNSTTKEYAIYYAIENNHHDIASYLLPLMNFQHINTTRLLSAAIKAGSLNIIQLLHKNLPINFDNAILLASTFGHLDIVKYLHQKLHLKPETNSSGNPIDAATQNNHAKVVHYLVQHTSLSVINAIEYATQHNRMHLLSILQLRTRVALKVQSNYNAVEFHERLEKLKTKLSN